MFTIPTEMSKIEKVIKKKKIDFSCVISKDISAVISKDIYISCNIKRYQTPSHEFLILWKPLILVIDHNA